ncbi:signal transduction histidine kinase [Streptacidiphilus sp. MAP12-20]|uniref:sensor histidine kinase n=1 Tax=Streptacidiphilus sp. MAP12-20 TaxID=3156299 RepID=UPI003512610A
MSAPTRLTALAAPVLGRQTLLRWAHLVLGGALAMPYFMLADVAAGIGLRAQATGETGLVNQILAFFASLALAAASAALIPAVRVIEGSAARALLGGAFASMSTGRATAPGARARGAAWYTLHLGLGGLVSGATLAAPPFAAVVLADPLLGERRRSTLPWVRDVPVWWGPPLGLAVLLALGLAAAGSGRLLARCAPRLLGPSPAEALADRLAESEQRATRLAHRNRIARELHDSVGHALSVVTLQAGAASRVLTTDPDFARRALEAVEESARGALEELDQVLGLLREEATDRPPRRPVPDLGQLDQLLASTRAAGTEVHAEVAGDPALLPPTVSREAYRIVQEGLTNALRHGGKVPVRIVIGIGPDELEMEMTNPLSAPQPRRPGGGRGLTGLQERAAVLGGAVAAAREGDCWRLHLRLPLGGRP